MPATTLYTGLDLHKRSVFAFTVDATGEEIAREKLPARADSLALYFADLPVGPEGEHRAVAEATTGWYWVKDALSSLDVDFRLAHAKEVKAITGAKVKTDAHDARKLAQLLRVNLLPEAHVISDELRPLRDVLRTRLRLVERRTGALNSVARLLEKMNVRDVADLPEFMQLQARCHLDQAELLAAQVKELERALHPHLVPDEDVQRLLRIPGIGKVNAFTLKLEIDDIDRFPSDRAFFSYCRLVPGADNSADRIKHKRSAGGEPVSEAGFQPRHRPRHPALPRDPGLVSSETPEEGRAGSTDARRQRDRPHRVPRPPQAGGLQRHVQRRGLGPRQARAVAPAPEPDRQN